MQLGRSAWPYSSVALGVVRESLVLLSHIEKLLLEDPVTHFLGQLARTIRLLTKALGSILVRLHASALIVLLQSVEEVRKPCTRGPVLNE
jgi:hypothetical protein